MSRAELVGDIEIQPADIGEREARVFQVLEHLELDVTGEKILIGAAWLQLAALRERNGTDRRDEDIVIQLVEVYRLVADGLLTERHDDETDSGIVHLLSSRNRVDPHSATRTYPVPFAFWFFSISSPSLVIDARMLSALSRNWLSSSLSC